MNNQELSTVLAVVGGSGPGKIVAAFMDRIVRAWPDARLRRGVRRASTMVEALGAWQRVRCVGAMIVAAAATDGLLRLFDPRPAAPLRLWLWCAACVAGVTVYVLAQPLSQAWSDRRRPASTQ